MKRSATIASLLAVLVALGCGDDAPPTDVEPEVYTLEASETPAGEAVVGAAVTAAVEVTDGDGGAAEGLTVRWSVLEGGGALGSGAVTTDGSGTASVEWTLGTAAGENRIEASVDGTAPVAFTVEGTPDAPAEVELSPSTVSFDAAGESAELSAGVLDAHGNEVPEASVSWTSDAPDVASVDAGGTVESLKKGTATVTAAADTAEAQATVLVDPDPAAVEVSPAALGTFDGEDTVSVGEELSQELEATVEDANGNPIAGADVTWSVSDAGTAMVEQDGTVTGVREGTATVTAASGEASASIDVVVPGKIAFASQRDGNREIYLVNADGTDVTRLTDNGESDFSPSWSPDGSRMTFRSDRDGNAEIYVTNADGSDPTRLTNVPEFDTSPSWSPDGSKVVFYSRRDGNDEIYTVSATGAGPTRVTNDTETDWQPSWSPDGGTIAFVSRRDGNYEIYAIDPDGANLTRLTNDMDTDWIPSWSPDGSKITFQSDRDGDDDIFVMDPDGSNETNLTTNPGGIDRDAAWSPDGSQILFWSNRDGNWEVYVMDADGTNQTNLTNHTANDFRPVWSPDGSKIAFYSDRDGVEEIYVMNADGSEQTRLTDSGADDSSPKWRPSP